MVQFFKKEFIKFIFSGTNASFVRRFGYFNKAYLKYPILLKLTERNTIQLISTDDVNQITFEISKKIRIHRYSKGVRSFLNKLAKQYFLDTIDFREGDTIIDCGANIGEVGLWFKHLQKNIKVHAIEPETAEADACDANIYDGKTLTIRKALWKEVGQLSFFSKNSSGDSSLFEQEGFEKRITIQATTLENLVKDKNIQHIRLLKLEAEGAEPEILIGAEKVLSLIDYIAVDCGPERGLAAEPTFIPVYNYLTERGYQLVDIKFDRVVALFKRDHSNN